MPSLMFARVGHFIIFLSCAIVTVLTLQDLLLVVCLQAWTATRTTLWTQSTNASP